MANTSELDRGLPTPSFYWNYRHMAHRRNDSDTVILPASSSISLPALPQLQAQNLSLQEPIVPKRSSYSYSENIPSSKSWKSSFRRSSSHNPAFPSAGMMDRTTTLDTDYLSVPSTATSSSEPATPNGRVRRRSILKTLFSTTNHMPSSLPCGSPGVVVSTSNMQGPSQRQSGIVPLRNLGLHQGAATGNIGLVKFALDLGQPVNSVLNGVLPIHVACCSGSVQTVQMLLDHGADVNARRYPRKYSGNVVILSPKVNARGSTPLHFAAANGDLAIVKLLLSNNADWTLRDDSGQTPLTAALLRGHPYIVKLIQTFEQIGNDALSDNYSNANHIKIPVIRVPSRSSSSYRADGISIRSGTISISEHETLELGGKCSPIHENTADDTADVSVQHSLSTFTTVKSQQLVPSDARTSSANKHVTLQNNNSSKPSSFAARFLLGPLAASLGKTIRRWSVADSEVGVASPSPTSTESTMAIVTPSPSFPQRHLSTWSSQHDGSLNMTRNVDSGVASWDSAASIMMVDTSTSYNIIAQSTPSSPTSACLPVSTLERRSDTDPTPNRPLTPRCIPSKLSNSMLASSVDANMDVKTMASDATMTSDVTHIEMMASDASSYTPSTRSSLDWRRRLSTTTVQSRQRATTDSSESHRSSLLPSLLFRRR